MKRNNRVDLSSFFDTNTIYVTEADMIQEKNNARSDKRYSVAVVGATGVVGTKTIDILVERGFPLGDCIAVASERQFAKSMMFGDRKVDLLKISDVDFSKYDLTFLCVPDAVAKKHIDQIIDAGSVVIDKSASFRLDPKVPLIVPEVNGDMLEKGAHKGIVAGPNCIAAPLCVVLKALSSISPIKRAVISTYQSISGAGLQALETFFKQSKNVIVGSEWSGENGGEDPDGSDGIFPEPAAFNVIPSIGGIDSEGFSGEEKKVADEVRKILKSDVKIAITCVRVPTFIGHCMSIACEFEEAMSDSEAFEALNDFEGIVTIDRRDGDGIFITPRKVEGEDAVFVSRVRRDYSTKNGLLLWVASDNLRKGAALNSVQIAEEMIRIDPTLDRFRKH